MSLGIARAARAGRPRRGRAAAVRRPAGDRPARAAEPDPGRRARAGAPAPAREPGAPPARAPVRALPGGGRMIDERPAGRSPADAAGGRRRLETARCRPRRSPSRSGSSSGPRTRPRSSSGSGWARARTSSSTTRSSSRPRCPGVGHGPDQRDRPGGPRPTRRAARSTPTRSSSSAACCPPRPPRRRSSSRPGSSRRCSSRRCPAGRPSAPGARDRDEALYFDRMTRRLPAGLSRDGEPVYLDVDFLDGTRGAHVNISRDQRRRHEDDLRAVPALRAVPLGGARRVRDEHEGARVQREGRGPALARPPERAARRRRPGPSTSGSGCRSGRSRRSGCGRRRGRAPRARAGPARRAAPRSRTSRAGPRA